MRRLWSTVALLAVLVGLGGYIYFGDVTPTPDSEAQEKLFPSLDAAQIEELKVKSDRGEVTTLKKEAGVWKIVAPISTEAGEQDAAGIANALADMSVVRVVDEAPADVKDYGLDTPRVEIDFKSADGKASGRLLVGTKTATGGNLYVRRNDETRVLLIGEYYGTTLNKSTFDLREKRIVKFDRTAVDRVEVVADATNAEFAKANGEWSMKKPVASRADFSAVEGLLGAVESAQMKSIVPAPSAADLKKFGFDKPQATVNIHLGSARAGLIVGSKADDGTVYVRDVSKPDVFTVDATTVDGLKKSADDYRKKELFDFRAFSATRIEITRDGKTLTLERVKSTDASTADSWKRLTPTAGDADREKVESFLAGLADIRAVSFVDAKTPTGLASPAMTVLAKFDEGKKEEKVTFGKTGADVFTSRPDDPGAGRIDPSKFDDAVKSFDELAK